MSVHPSLRSYAELLGDGMDLSAAGIGAANALLDKIAEAATQVVDPGWEIREASAKFEGRTVATLVAADPTDSDPSRVLVWAHGGGFVTGRPEQDLALLRELCVPTGAVAIGVRYRLAPEADLDDMVADVRTALGWAGIRWPNAVRVLGGESAGGALAVLAVLDDAPHSVGADALLLLCPMLDDATADPDGATWAWSASNSRDAWQLAGVDHTRSRPPARHPSLCGLPPTHIEYGELDVLAPETARFAARLRGCAVPPVVHCTAGAVHGFAHAGPGPLVDAALQRLRRTLRTASRHENAAPRPAVAPTLARKGALR